MPKPKTKTPRATPVRRPIVPARGACVLAGPGLQAVVTAAAVQLLTQEAPVILPRLLVAVAAHRAAGRRRRTEHAVGKVKLHVMSSEDGVIVAASSDFAEAAA